MDLADLILVRLSNAGITTREAATALPLAVRDDLLSVAAWGGTEDAAWEQALERLPSGFVS